MRRGVGVYHLDFDTVDLVWGWVICSLPFYMVLFPSTVTPKISWTVFSVVNLACGRRKRRKSQCIGMLLVCGRWDVLVCSLWGVLASSFLTAGLTGMGVCAEHSVSFSFLSKLRVPWTRVHYWSYPSSQKDNWTCLEMQWTCPKGVLKCFLLTPPSPLSVPHECEE